MALPQSIDKDAEVARYSQWVLISEVDPHTRLSAASAIKLTASVSVDHNLTLIVNLKQILDDRCIRKCGTSTTGIYSSFHYYGRFIPYINSIEVHYHLELNYINLTLSGAGLAKTLFLIALS